MGYDIKLVGARLRSLRAEKHVTQKEVADNTDLTATSIGIYENEQGGMNLETAWRLADYYGVSLDELVGRKGICGLPRHKPQGITE